MVDVLLRVLAKAIPDRVPAGSAGTMSNLTIGGLERRGGDPLSYGNFDSGDKRPA